jgi:hypothetical protein
VARKFSASISNAVFCILGVQPVAGVCVIVFDEVNRREFAGRFCAFAPVLMAIATFLISSSLAYTQTHESNDSIQGGPAQQVPKERESVPIEFPLPPVDLRSVPRNLFIDQKNFWTAPLHLTAHEWQWTLPIAFVGAGLLASDTTIEKHLSGNAVTNSRASNTSNAGLGAFAGVAGGMFVFGHMTGNDEMRETGILSGEAGVDAFLDTEAFSYIFRRQRPTTDTGKGLFFHGGDSFPSNHAAISWAIASVIAHEYPGPVTQMLAYGAAGAVSVARLEARKHFATDVLIGSALGWYIGRQVFRSHSHYSDAEIRSWGTFSRNELGEPVRTPDNMGSPFVPLDSWIYSAMERLIAMGYIRSADLGMRPWTRMECARLLHEEAEERLKADDDQNREAQKLYSDLVSEFSRESSRMDGTASNLDLQLDSVYERFTGISGPPLHDGFHFGQTIVNDYGRPYAEGFNNIAGFTAHALAGPISLYLRGEYQHAPGSEAISPQTGQIIQTVDGLPAAPPSTMGPARSRFDLLEGYAGMQLNNWQFTFGKQSLWWGEDASGPMLFSNNAEPILMLQVNRVKPLHLPSLLGLLGPLRVDFIAGRLTGQRWIFGEDSGFIGSWSQSLSDQPYIVGEKISFKPTPNVEFGISATTLFGGRGVPATAGKLVKAIFSPSNGQPGTAQDAGDRRGGFDFAYRMPYARDWITLYADAFTDDEPNPWLAWDKTALTSGLYFARLPKIPKLDLRVEGVFTDLPGGGPVVQHGFFYNNDRFRSGYTNDGNLIGSWIGREGQGAEAWTAYHFNSKSKVQLNFRHQKISEQFIPGGGSLSDLGVSADVSLSPKVSISGWVQHERWLIPAVKVNTSENWTAAFQISFQPFAHPKDPAPNPGAP